MTEWLSFKVANFIFTYTHLCAQYEFEGHMWDKSNSACGVAGIFSQGVLLFSPDLPNVSEKFLKGT